MLSGDVPHDFLRITDFMHGVRGKITNNAAPIRLMDAPSHHGRPEH